MLNWLTRQRRQLHGFYRDGFGRALGMTVLAFAAVMVVSYAVTMANAAPIERLMNLFREQIADRGIVDADGNFSAVKLFFNNFQACLLAVGYGFIPFLYLPAVSLGINAMMFGGFASYYVQQGLPLWYYGAGTLPHGVFELPALFMAMAGGLYLCRTIVRYVRHNEKGLMGPAVLNLARLLVMHITPLLMARPPSKRMSPPLLWRRWRGISDVVPAGVSR